MKLLYIKDDAEGAPKPLVYLCQTTWIHVPNNSTFHRPQNWKDEGALLFFGIMYHASL